MVSSGTAARAPWRRKGGTFTLSSGQAQTVVSGTNPSVVPVLPEAGISTLFSEHDPMDVLGITTRALWLPEGDTSTFFGGHGPRAVPGTRPRPPVHPKGGISAFSSGRSATITNHGTNTRVPVPTREGILELFNGHGPTAVAGMNGRASML